MRILFFHPFLPERVHPLTYENLMEKSGFSGSETALIEIAKYLADRNHDITICCVTQLPYINNKIRFIPYNQLNNIEQYDIFCPMMFCDCPEYSMILNRLPQKTIIWLWLQCCINHSHIYNLQKRGFKVIITYLSKFSENNYDKSLFHSTSVIGNAINQIFIDTPKAPPLHRKGNWFFHATFERGGLVAQRVFQYVKNRLPESAKTLSYASYYTPDSNSQHLIPIKWLGSISRMQIANILATTDYFIYPLSLPSSQVHHDTYGSVILEALASGVIVITWNVACIPDVYSDYVVGLDPIIVDGYNPKYAFNTYNKWMMSDEAVKRLADQVIYLEEHPEEKERIRQRGMKWAQQFTWEHRGSQFEPWLLSNLS